MSTNDVNVTIGFQVETQELQKANDILKEMTMNLEKFNSMKGARVETGVSVGAIRETANSMLNVKKAVEQTKEPVVTLLDSMNRFAKMDMTSLDKAFPDISTKLGINTRDLEKFWDILQFTAPKENLIQVGKSATDAWTALGKGPIEAQLLAEKTTLMAAALKEANKEIITFGERGVKSEGLRAYMQFASQAGIPKATARSIHKQAVRVMEPESQIPEGEGQKSKQLTGDYAVLQAALRDLSEEQKKASVVRMALANADKLVGAPMQSLENITRQQGPALAENAQKLRQLGNEYRVFRAYLQGARSILGPFGMAFRDISSQIYWMSLGFLFLSMTMSRAERSHVTMLSRANDLAKSLYNLKQMELDARDATFQYGAGSREAARVSAQLKMAQGDLVIQQKMLAVSIKTEILQSWQQQISLLPVLINTMQLLLTVTQAAGGFAAAHAEQTRQSTMASIIDAAAKKSSAVAGIVNAAATNQGTAANIGFTGTTPGLLSSLKAMVAGFMTSAIGAKFLVGALTLGIGAVIAFAASNIMAAKAQQEMEAMLKRINEEAENAADSYGDLGSSIYDVNSIVTRFNISITEVSKNINDIVPPVEDASDALSGRSLTDAFNDATRSGIAFGKAMESVGNTKVVYSVTGSIEDLPTLIEEVNLKYNRGEIPEIEDTQQNVSLEYRLMDMPELPSFPDIARNVNLAYIKPEDPILNNLQRDILLKYADVPDTPSIPDISKFINLEYSNLEAPILNDLQQTVDLKYIPKELPVVTQEINIPKNVEPITKIEEIRSVGRGNVVINVSFPNLTIREEADINKITSAIDAQFQSDYYADGGRVSNYV